MGGVGNPINGVANGAGALGAAAGVSLGGAIGQFVEKCTSCLQCLKDKLCASCAGGMRDGDEKCRAAEEQGEKAWGDAQAFMKGQGTGFRMAIGAGI